MKPKKLKRMYQNKEYRIMCIKADEIQELWEPEPGDFTIWKPGSTPHVINETDFTGIDQRGCKDTPDRHWWLPKQEDLEEIVINHNPEFIDVGKLLDEFMSGWGHYTGLYKDMNTLWLGFIMEYIFGKQWNGHNWENLDE